MNFTDSLVPNLNLIYIHIHRDYGSFHKGSESKSKEILYSLLFASIGFFFQCIDARTLNEQDSHAR